MNNRSRDSGVHWGQEGGAEIRSSTCYLSSSNRSLPKALMQRHTEASPHRARGFSLPPVAPRRSKSWVPNRRQRSPANAPGETKSQIGRWPGCRAVETGRCLAEILSPASLRYRSDRRFSLKRPAGLLLGFSKSAGHGLVRLKLFETQAVVAFVELCIFWRDGASTQ